MQHALHRPEDSTASEVDLCDEGTVKEFMQAARNVKEPVNCLDAPQVAGPAPTIIKCVFLTQQLYTLLTISQQIVGRLRGVGLHEEDRVLESKKAVNQYRDRRTKR